MSRIRSADPKMIRNFLSIRRKPRYPGTREWKHASLRSHGRSVWVLDVAVFTIQFFPSNPINHVQELRGDEVFAFAEGRLFKNRLHLVLTLGLHLRSTNSRTPLNNRVGGSIIFSALPGLLLCQLRQFSVWESPRTLTPCRNTHPSGYRGTTRND